ncbi:MAG TPA: hypothetical protein PK867_00670 [Pirellulales bacterium]|nr:hypothetical protein [Pirellulales bacterium]
MTVPLAKALEQVDLDAGNIYRCRVKGQWVEVRVFATEPPGLAKPFVASEVMIDPWVELPGVSFLRRCPARRGLDFSFDVPSAPTDSGACS